MLVYYGYEIVILEMTIRENLFIELKHDDPDRMVIITAKSGRYLVKISELETASERRL